MKSHCLRAAILVCLVFVTQGFAQVVNATLTGINTGTFGQITTKTGSRNLQVQLHLDF